MKVYAKSCLIVLGLILLNLTAYGETTDDLSGYSIDFTAITTPVSITGYVTGHTERNGKFYISSLNRIFVIETDSSGGQVAGQPSVRSIGRAFPSKYGEIAYTVEAGNLKRITALVEGFRVETIQIDQSRSRCIYQAELQPSPITKRIVMTLLNGRNVELSSTYKVDSSNCTIRKGNIFQTVNFFPKYRTINRTVLTDFVNLEHRGPSFYPEAKEMWNGLSPGWLWQSQSCPKIMHTRLTQRGLTVI